MNQDSGAMQRQSLARSQAGMATRKAGGPLRSRLAEIDVEALADRVYERLLDALRLEQERGA